MELRIRDSNQIVDVEFGNWLISLIKVKLLSSLTKYNFDKWNEYLTKSDKLTRLYTRNYTVFEVVRFASTNIVCKGSDGDISIQFDNTKLVPGFDRLHLHTIVKTINYGTLDIKGCPIFTDTFDYFSKDIDTYVSMYYDV